MNRYEALNALGLEQGASDEDVRLAYYGLAKAVETQDFAGHDRMASRVGLLLDRAGECRDFLLANGTGGQGVTGAARTGGVASTLRGARGRTPKAKMEISAEREAQARLLGLERLRLNLLGYRDQQAQRRLACLVAILASIVVGFVAFRYVRVLAPRMVMLVAVCAAAIASSAGFTTAHLQCRAVRTYLLDIDEHIRELRVRLGLEEEDPEGQGVAGERGVDDGQGSGMASLGTASEEDPEG